MKIKAATDAENESKRKIIINLMDENKESVLITDIKISGNAESVTVGGKYAETDEVGYLSFLGYSIGSTMDYTL